jgi:hypothetical protein
MHLVYCMIQFQYNGKYSPVAISLRDSGMACILCLSFDKESTLKHIPWLNAQLNIKMQSPCE